MKKYKAILVILSGLLFSSFSAGKDSFSVVRDQKLLIVFIGDSITYGAGLADPLHESPPAIACDALGKMPGIGIRGWSNQGVSGFTTVDFLPGIAPAFD